jgi:hypothetical protein
MEAVCLLLLRMEAFNEKDIVKLRAIDKMALKLSREQFDAWLAGWGNYTLHYVEAINNFGPGWLTRQSKESACTAANE